MGWAEQHGLQSRLASLPPLLVGPVLRQVTANAVTVWVALKRSYDVKLDILGSDSDSGTPIMSGSLRTTALGTNLHIAAVTARSTGVLDTLSEGKIYFYNLTFTPGGSPVQLNFSQALTPEASSPGAVQVKSVLGCGSYSLPSFALPPQDLANLKLLHGSCRKPHAEGRDALAIVETLIQQHYSSPLERPHQLLLTGDQIYADDVADGLLLMLTDASETLLGWSETVDRGGALSPLRFADWPSYYREAILEDAGFTSDDLKSHLMSLGEFLSMYLFVWSDVLWSKTLPAFADVSDAVVQPGVKLGLGQPWVDGVTAAVKGKQETIEEELGYVALLTATLPNVRRALANIPTYMICDDHEVTDDWNMTRRFCDEVYGRPIGRRVVQNALVAFALCQAWGNNPDRFSANPVTAGATLLSTLANVSGASAASRAGVYEASGSVFQILLGIHPATVVLPKGGVFHDPETNLPKNAENKVSLRFDFHVEGPGHLILVTDTRTWRIYPQKGVDTPADFLPGTSTPPQLTSQLSIDPSHVLGDRILIVVLTTNAPPIASVRYLVRHRLLLDTMLHLGPIRLVKAAYENFAGSSEAGMPKDLTGARRAIYEKDLYDSWELPGDRFDRLITQLDSLAQTGSRKQVLLLSGDVHSSFASRLTIFGPDPDDGIMGTPRLVIGQLVSSPFKNQEEKTRGQQMEGYTYAPREIARHLPPPHVPEAFEGPGGRSVYRLDYLVADSGQPPPGGFPDFLLVKKDEDVANLRNYDSMDTFGRGLLRSGASPLQIIGHNNLAELTFASANAHHAVHWYGPSGPPYTTTYTVSLNLNDPAYPIIDPGGTP
jgi:hypothetical protein